MLKQFSLIVICVAVLMGCVSKPNVRTNYRDYYDFSTISSYAIYSRNSEFNNSQLITDVRRNRIEMAIEDAFDGIGLIQENETKADILIGYYVVNRSSDLFRYNARVRACYYCKKLSYKSGKRYQAGTLIVDLIDPKTEISVWRGVTKKTINSKNSSSENQEFIYYSIQRMLEKFPPQLDDA